MTTTLEKDGALELSSISADWDYKASKPDSWPDNPRLSSIEYHPGSANDRCIFRHKDIAGIRRFDSNYSASDNDSRIKYFHGVRCVPYLKYSECVFSAGAYVIIELWREA